MKLPFTIYDLRFTICKKSAPPAAFNRQSSIVNRQSRRGVALVITLILLSVVLFMAVTFLALSRRERGAVATVTDTAGARYAADAALANAEAQIIANIFSSTNPYNFGLIVSTNYINPVGFQSGASSFTNVNYQYASGSPLSQNDLLQNLTNLWYSPRPPVFIPIPGTASNDFRYYLDLNRNGRDDPNGLQLVISPNSSYPYYDTNGNLIASIIPGNTLSNLMVGDPEWIGVLERPDAPYGPNNKFIARYAFIAVPVGNTLDLNYIYNDATQPDSSMAFGHDGFFRNQGVGSWELNLAAFLTDLNTNEWDPVANPYLYDTWIGTLYNSGAGFSDALSLLKYRYGGGYTNLASVDILYGGPPFGAGYLAFINDGIDGYSDGRLQTTFDTNADFLSADNPALHWSGADNTNHYFTHQELFNPAETEINVAPPGFVEHLQQAGTNVSTYDRYTFYRLLSQLGTDSAPEQGKMNLNYMNVDANGNVVPGMETNFISWTNALQFFTNAADRLLRAYTAEWRAGNPTNFAATFYATTAFTNAFFTADQWTNYPAFGVGNIPVLVSNQLVYSPAVNRLLQLAANLYDATTNDAPALSTNNYPSVFRPTFWVTNDNGYINVYINGYQQVVSVTGTSDPKLSVPFDFTDLKVGASINNYPFGVNVYGVPWIIGAKKGFPSFNEFSFESMVQVSRKLEIWRPSFDALLSSYVTNQMYVMSINNTLGVECWNSYSNNYVSGKLNGLQIYARDGLSMMLTNAEPGGATMSPPVVLTNWPYFGAPYVMANGPSLTTWPGSAPWTTAGRNNLLSPNNNSFDTPLMAFPVLLTNSIYLYKTHQFIPAEGSATTNYEDQGIAPMPQFGLLTTNRLQVMMVDQDKDNSSIYHVIDYVQFAGPDSYRNLNAEIADYDPNNPTYGLWNTNCFGGAISANAMPYGVFNQVEYAMNPQLNGGLLIGNDVGTWQPPPGGGHVGDSIAALNAFLSPNHHASGTDLNGYTSPQTSNLNQTVQVPFTPTRVSYQYISWQANDPLVHYIASDLNFTGSEPSGLQTGTHQWSGLMTNFPASNLGMLNDRYQPWGRLLQCHQRGHRCQCLQSCL